MDLSRDKHNEDSSPGDIQLTKINYTNNDAPRSPSSQGVYNRAFDGSREQSFDSGFNNNAETKGQSIYTIDDPKSPQQASPDDDFEDLEDEGNSNCFLNCISSFQNGMNKIKEKHGKVIKWVFIILLACAYFVYFAFAMMHEKLKNEDSVRLCWVTCCVVAFVIWHFFWKFCGKSISENSRPCWEWCSNHSEKISWIVVGVFYVILIIIIIVDVTTQSKDAKNLIPISGILLYVCLCFIFSYDPSKVKWRPVAWGIALQFMLALIILRWSDGFAAFRWLGARVEEFLLHTDAGSKFVFGDNLYVHFFAFKLMPVVIFFSMIISILYYLGVMQAVIGVVAKVMQVTMGTTAGESLNAAGNIFVGQSEAPLMIRPILPDMTRSEIHAVMTGGFATIAGTVMAAYIGFGAPAEHLISASVMSAPAALAMAKLFYPETQKSKTTAKDVAVMEKSDAHNLVEAAASGASSAISLVANIVANLIAFLALLAFVNATLGWFGDRAGFTDHFGFPLSLEWILSYLLIPFAFVMGVAWPDCRMMSELIGIKTILNEFVAYTRLGYLNENRLVLDSHIALNKTWEWVGDNIHLYDYNASWPLGATRSGLTLGDIGGVLEKGVFEEERSKVIATYALCGFANLGSIGIMIGALTAMAPKRKTDIASVAVRAMIAGNVACFMTACIAGLFYKG